MSKITSKKDYINQRLAAIVVFCLTQAACVWMEPVSVTSTGLVAGAVEDDSGISSDGRYITFTPVAGLVPADTNSIDDIYRFDTATSTILLVSVAPSGDGGNAGSKQPSISGDGSIIAFASAATNLGSASNGHVQIYIRNIPAGTTQLATSTVGNADSAAPSVSADGSTVAFSSHASNLDPSDTNGVSDVFSFDIGGGSVSRRSVAAGGGVPDGASTEPSSNADGTIIAFTSEATNLVLGDSNGVADVFSVDAGGTIERISHGVLGEGDAPSGQPSMASGSNTISFSSSASNLVVGDTNAVVDIFVHTPGSNIQRIVKLSGTQFSAESAAPSINSDATRVAFLTDGSNIGQSTGLIAVAVDLIDFTISAISVLGNSDNVVPATHVSISSDGAYASFNSIAKLDGSDTNGISDVYARFAYTTRIEPWSFFPGKVEAGTATTVTITGKSFRVDGPAPTIWIPGGASGITFSNVLVLNSFTITATMSMEAWVVNDNYQVWMKFAGGGPGPGSGATQTCSTCLTVADPDPVADMVDIASSIGLPLADGGSAGLLVEDLNDDTFEDVLFIRHEPTQELLLLGDGSGLNISPQMNGADRHECASADVNNDGRTDIYCSVGSGAGSGTGDNNLWIQQADGSYIDEAASWGVTDSYGRGRDVVFLYANNDSLPDLFVSNWGPRTDGNVSSNQLFINNGGTTFSAAPEYGVDGELASFCALTADFDDDGDDDLVVCGSDRVRMYENQAGAGFLDVSASLGFSQRLLDAAFADIDGDGDLDMAIASETGFEIHRLAQGVDDGVVFLQSASHPRAVAFGDINGDGTPDAYFVQRGCRTEIEQNLPDVVALSSGGTFVAIDPPDVQRGCGDAVVSFDHDADGTDGFLVGNGRGRRGPLQYLVLP